MNCVEGNERTLLAEGEERKRKRGEPFLARVLTVEVNVFLSRNCMISIRIPPDAERGWSMVAARQYAHEMTGGMSNCVLDKAGLEAIWVYVQRTVPSTAQNQASYHVKSFCRNHLIFTNELEQFLASDQLSDSLDNLELRAENPDMLVSMSFSSVTGFFVLVAGNDETRTEGALSRITTLLAQHQPKGRVWAGRQRMRSSGRTLLTSLPFQSVLIGVGIVLINQVQAQMGQSIWVSMLFAIAITSLVVFLLTWARTPSGSRIVLKDQERQLWSWEVFNRVWIAIAGIFAVLLFLAEIFHWDFTELWPLSR